MPKDAVKTAVESVPPSRDDGGQNGHETHLRPAPIIPQIQEVAQLRRDVHGQEKATTLRMKAICRRFCDGEKDKADAMYTQYMTGEAAAEVEIFLDPLNAARAPVKAARLEAEKTLTRLAKSLPVWPWCEDVRGVGPLALALIVGEAGDLLNYANPGKLWKRLGLARVQHGSGDWQTQGHPLGKTSAADWVAHGYSPARRSVMWNVGASLIRAQKERICKETGEIRQPSGPYYTVYAERKAYEAAKNEAGDYAEQAARQLAHINPTAGQKKHLEAGMLTPAHINARAQRYMEKRFIRDLWKAWKEAQDAE